MVWVRGGNTFLLKSIFEQSGFDTVIFDLLNQDKIVYGGYSAGIVILTPTLKGIELVDDLSLVPDKYTFRWDGLGILPFSIAPHYRSDHPESEAIESVVEYFEKNNMPYKTLRDGQVIVVDGDPKEFQIITENGYTPEYEAEMIAAKEEAMKSGKTYTSVEELHKEILDEK